MKILIDRTIAPAEIAGVGVGMPSSHPDYRALAPVAGGREYHVALNGNDAGEGTAEAPLRTISAGAQRAQPGDVITVHGGVYRERVNPPRGGTSAERRIVYQAAPGERVEITGSERVTGWIRGPRGVWNVELPNDVFGDFNPFADEIRGDWFNPKGRKHHTGAVYCDGVELCEAEFLYDVLNPLSSPNWSATADENLTRISARFGDVNPNEATVEIHARKTVFYPGNPGINYITVRGFIMRHAATPWAPPTAEQIGLIGTHWSKGWIIEHNEISHSRCTGITLGKYGDRWDNTSADTAEGYVETVRRALERGWSKETIGGHLIRNNHVFGCEQAAIVGSLGAAFSEVTGNVIHDIHQAKVFDGAEQGAIKFHGAIDTIIRGNHIFHTHRAIWLDWMAQGTRVTGNLCHDNDVDDLFVEVNHGPFLVDNNVFLSARSLLDRSEGGTYAHNLMAGIIWFWPDSDRETPYHEHHETAIAGLAPIIGGDDRFYNNLIVDAEGFAGYREAAQPVTLAGNILLPERPHMESDAAGLRLTLVLADSDMARQKTLVTTALLGRTRLADQAFEQPDGNPIVLDTDFFGNARSPGNLTPGPFELG